MKLSCGTKTLRGKVNLRFPRVGFDTIGADKKAA